MVAFEGLAAPFMVATVLRGDSRPVRFAPGAFARAIKSGRVEAWLNHRPGRPLATQRDGTLGLAETSAGLSFWFCISEHSRADMLRWAAEGGLLRGASVAWNPTTSSGRLVGDTLEITHCTLIEVSLITAPNTPQFPRTVARLSTQRVERRSA